MGTRWSLGPTYTVKRYKDSSKSLMQSSQRPCSSIKIAVLQSNQAKATCSFGLFLARFSARFKSRICSEAAFIQSRMDAAKVALSEECIPWILAAISISTNSFSPGVIEVAFLTSTLRTSSCCSRIGTFSFVRILLTKSCFSLSVVITVKLVSDFTHASTSYTQRELFTAEGSSHESKNKSTSSKRGIASRTPAPVSRTRSAES
mmetsp:Transcript_17535/g.30903  ORF Transcript_17535/g.30903 Transcript_17535/m.30903 type:complete len:204 (+) Transcript_17535:813-1424(+)